MTTITEMESEQQPSQSQQQQTQPQKAGQKQIELTEQSAPQLLRVFLEQAQKCKAGLSLVDAAAVHRAIQIIGDALSLSSSSSSPKPSEDAAAQGISPADALSLCVQALEKGQAAGGYSLEEAHNAVMVLAFIERKLVERNEKQKSRA